MHNKSSIAVWLTSATDQLRAIGITSARLDAELLLAHTLRKSRTWIHAHGDEMIDSRTKEIANARLDLRLDRVPIAYIIGHKEFYGRRFTVTTSTLIPRPESEAMIELLKTIPLQPGMKLVDVGTGTGCLGITAKLEHPDLEVTLIDIDKYALTVADKNAAAHGAVVESIKSNLLSQYPYIADIILANLPYVDKEWVKSPELRHEPAMALFADDNGLSLIKQLIDQHQTKLRPGGYVLLEADARQHHAMTHYAEQRGLKHVASEGLIALYQSV